VIEISEKAAEKVKSLLKERGSAQGSLRVFVVGGGCSGYQYGMALAKGAEKDDVVIEQGGVTLLVDPESATFLEGAEIDYVDDVMKSGFTISNPNAVNCCACGNSFQTADSPGTPRSCC
jgi:iron-sulfur cluster assembly protein